MKFRNEGRRRSKDGFSSCSNMEVERKSLIATMRSIEFWIRTLQLQSTMRL